MNRKTFIAAAAAAIAVASVSSAIFVGGGVVDDVQVFVKVPGEGGRLVSILDLSGEEQQVVIEWLEGESPAIREMLLPKKVRAAKIESKLRRKKAAKPSPSQP